MREVFFAGEQTICFLSRQESVDNQAQTSLLKDVSCQFFSLPVQLSNLIAHPVGLPCSKLLSLFGTSFATQPPGGCLPVQYLLRALTTAGAGEATRSGSPRHLSTVSHALSYAYTAGRLLSRWLLPQFYPFSCGVVRLRRMTFRR
jgi:hypothetical protein